MPQAAWKNSDYIRELNFYYQPPEGPDWQVQDKNMDFLKDALTGNHNCAITWLRTSLRLGL